MRIEAARLAILVFHRIGRDDALTCTDCTDPADTASTYRWDPTSQQYIFNWGTSKTGAGYFWQIGVKLDDGTFYVVDIGLR